MVFRFAGGQGAAIQFDRAGPVGLVVELLPLFVDDIGAYQTHIDEGDDHGHDDRSCHTGEQAHQRPACDRQSLIGSARPAKERVIRQNPEQYDDRVIRKVVGNVVQLQIQLLGGAGSLRDLHRGQPPCLHQPIDQPHTPYNGRV